MYNLIFISQLEAEFLKKMEGFQDKSIGLVSSTELEQSGKV